MEQSHVRRQGFAPFLRFMEFHQADLAPGLDIGKELRVQQRLLLGREAEDAERIGQSGQHDRPQNAGRILHDMIDLLHPRSQFSEAFGCPRHDRCDFRIDNAEAQCGAEGDAQAREILQPVLREGIRRRQGVGIAGDHPG